MNESTSSYKLAACERVDDLPLVHLRDSSLTGAGTSHHRRCVRVDRGILARFPRLILSLIDSEGK